MLSKKFKIVHRIPNSNILIDYWKPLTQDKYFRFMTYLRIDAKESIKDICESTYTIYTSIFNKWYLITYCQVSEHRIIELHENETLTVFDDDSNPAFSVTAFNANYCTGGLMFLFQGQFGNILYTGFFRPSSFDSIFEDSLLKSLVDKREIDVAYVDNTYAAEHCEFPSRSEIMDRIVTCLRQHPKHKVAISGKRLGKEEILLDIAKALDEKIHVSKEKFTILSRLNLQDHFTTDKTKSRIYACDKVIHPEECVKMQAKEGPYIVIFLTALYHCNGMSNNEEFNVPGLYIFPYSGHCSHSELVRFISFLKPRDIQPIIKFVTDEHSVIPPCIYKLCYKSHTSLECSKPSNSLDSKNFCSCESENSQKFYTCSHNSASPSAATTMVTVYDSVQKQAIIDDAINELKTFNDVDDFLDCVSNVNDVDRLGQDINESVITVRTMEFTGNLQDSFLNNLLSTSDNSSGTTFYTDATTGAGCSNQNSIIDDLSSVTTSPENQSDFSVSKTTIPYTKAFYKTFDDNATSRTSCTIITKDKVESPKEICDLSQTEVHPTNTYVENDIAENVISSTNNDTLPEVFVSPVQEVIEKNPGTNISVTVGDVDIDIRSDLDLQDMTDKDDLPGTSHVNNRICVEVQLPEQPDNGKKCEEKSIQTDLTLENIAQLEKLQQSQTSHNEAEPLLIRNKTTPVVANTDVTQLLAKYVATNPKAKFDIDRYYGKCSKKRGLEICTASACQECRTMEENIKQKKLMKSVLYRSAMAIKKSQIVPPKNTEFSESLTKYSMSHPIYKNRLNF